MFENEDAVAERWVDDHRERLIGLPLEEAVSAVVAAGFRVAPQALFGWHTDERGRNRITLVYGMDRHVLMVRAG